MEDKHEYTAVFHFLKGVLKGSDFADLISNGLGFRPSFIKATPSCGRNGKCKIDGRLSYLRDTETLERLELKIADDYTTTPRFWYSTFPFYEQINLHLKHSEIRDFESNFERFFSLPGFTAGFIHDGNDLYWQNEKLASNYDKSGVSYDHLRTEVVSPFVLVDTRPNPGYRLDLPGMQLTAAWRMWFSPLADRFFPTQRLAEFEGASVRELTGGVIEVVLYDNGTSYAAAAARRKQMAFRSFVDFNALIEAAPELLRQVSDPVYEINHGEVDGAPVLMLITWMNDSENHVPRSKATRRWVSLQRKNGESLWSCIETHPFSEIEFSPIPPPQLAQAQD